MSDNWNLERVKKDWEEISSTDIRVEEIGGTIYGFSSELAVLRLFHKYRYTKEARILFSKAYDSWAFTLDKKD